MWWWELVRPLMPVAAWGAVGVAFWDGVGVGPGVVVGVGVGLVWMFLVWVRGPVMLPVLL